MRPLPRPVWITIAGSILSAGSLLSVPTVAGAAPGSEPTLSLAQILEHAERHAPALATARAGVDLAAALAVDADLVFPSNPEVSVGAGVRTAKGDSGLDLEVGISQAFEVGGERGRRVHVARAERSAAEARVEEARWAVHVQAHALHSELLLAAAQRAQASRFVDFSRSLRDVAARQVEAGESSPLVLLVADADLAQTVGAQLEAAHHERALGTRLAAVIGWPEDALPPVEGALPPVRPAPDLAPLLERLSQQHPTLAREALEVATHGAKLSLAEREGWPIPTLGVAYGREAAPGPEPETEVWLVNLGVPLPVWRGSEGAVARARAQVELGQRQRAETHRRLRAELVGAARALDSAAAQVALYETDVVPQLERNLRLLQRAFELGEVDIHQVSQTRQRLLDASARHLAARVGYYEAAATLEGLVGAELWPETTEAR